MDLLDRAVAPSRLALIYRSGETLGYNPGLNSWHRLGEEHAVVLRWLRAGRDRALLPEHLSRRFALDKIRADNLLNAAVEWCVIRNLLYLDREPAPPDIVLPADPLATVYWICTQACNLRCTYCYQEAMVARPAELSTAEAYDLVDQIADSGARTMVFTGGEPFSRRDLLSVAGAAKAKGLLVNVITNGHFITRKNVQAVADVFNLVSVSLDHSRPEHHDSHRGKGSWRRAVNAIKLLLEAGVSVDINSVLSRSGLKDVDELINFVQAKTVRQHRIVAQFPMGRGATARNDELSAPEILGLPDQLHRIHANSGTPQIRAEGSYSTKKQIRIHCGAGLSEISVDPEGWVYPCKLLQYPEFRTQNVRDSRIVDIYANNPILRATRGRTAQNLQPCRTCIIRSGCGGGCRGIHYSFTGDYGSASPLFCAYLRRQFEVKAWSSSGDGKIPSPRANEYSEKPAPPTTLVPISAVLAKVRRSI